MKTEKITILFLCTGNSCRSQMAEGFARYYWPELVEAWSAGIEVHGMNQHAIHVMAETGVDISDHYSKLLEELTHITFDYVITVCGHAHETCPIFPGQSRVIHKSFDDPPRLAKQLTDPQDQLDCYRKVRDEIEQYVKTLPESLPGF